MKPLVSILIPAYNAEKWIAESLRSAIRQTWPNKEIIVVDDGSRDGTLQLARRFESNGVRITSQPNQGAAAARNRAFALSKGDYIQWLDADDLLSPDKIALQMEVAAGCADKRTLFSAGWGRFLYRAGHAQFLPNALWNDLTPKEWLLRKMEQNLHMQTATWLVTRELTEKAGPWNTELLGDDDGEYFCRVLIASCGIRFVPGARVYYRASGANSLSYIGRSERKLVAQWRSMQLHIGYLRSMENSAEDSARIRAACLRYLQNWFSNFYPEHSSLIGEMQAMAAELGGRLQPPRLSWKYGWIRRTFGWPLAKRAQIVLPGIRWSIANSWDRALFRMAAVRESNEMGI